MTQNLATLASGGRVLPGDQLEQQVRQAAGALRALGLVPGDVVCMLMRNDFPVLELALAADRVGVVAVPLNWHASADDLDHILRDAGARLLVAHTDLLARLPALPAACLALQVPPPREVRTAYRLGDADCAAHAGIADYAQWRAAAAPWDGPATPPPYRLLYTSGSTGRPKGVRRDTRDAATNAAMAQRTRTAHGLSSGPIRAVMTGPLYHSAPYAYALNCVRMGELLVLQPRFDAAQLLALIAQQRITHLHAVPTMFSRLLDLPEAQRSGVDLSSLRSVAHGAAMCPREVKQAMIAWWGPILHEYYAATEIGIMAACTAQEWLQHPGTVGRAPEGVEISIVDDAGMPLPAGGVGEILVRSDVVASVSYQHLPDALASLRREGGWATLGDIGYQDADGFLWLCDRKSDLVISGGVNIFPAEVEQAVLRMDGVKDCIAFGIPDRDLGEALALYVEPHAGAGLDAPTLHAGLLQTLGRLRVPREIRLVDSLPREDSGKLARRKIKAAHLQAAQTAS
ncbi:MAG TPA: AMP-binding protein [Pseudorhodoferax sp.]|nr:AMP-binding protein [Pseudorhodoferax sp.]